ncbi:Glycosyltransferase involved in cell wall bisynthesis [Chitinophaga costaii]|uniref:Glycosyltransferase involved in cell wall bisynthesis n=1 Tax=Chitinophaga costaii TaxID=1335309 RepID=A0A1C4ESH8_9BACT|nr:Glycosyltransferase involved in cell wall bisynthesis [Chitinophaga costaii]
MSRATLFQVSRNGNFHTFYMNIAFDAKRAFQNNTGLGNYSRTLIRSLAADFPQHQYFLFAPKPTTMFPVSAFSNIHTVLPTRFLHRKLRALWRSKWVTPELAQRGMDLYHGLSHEVPFGIHNSGVKSVVTMHDLIFERFPGQYNPIDVFTYRRKARYAAHAADRVIAISEQTKADLVQFYNVHPGKITVCYQSCDPSFEGLHTASSIAAFRAAYHLPEKYLLSVGSVIERKNLLAVVQALRQSGAALPLVVLGNGDGYMKKVKAWIAREGMEKQVIWLNEQGRMKGEELPLLYQGATALLYVSLFEGFGIPILEALWSGTPVITSQGSCFAETAGNAALYVDPLSVEAIAGAIRTITTDEALAADLREKGFIHARHFTPEKCAAAVMEVYRSLF